MLYNISQQERKKIKETEQSADKRTIFQSDERQTIVILAGSSEKRSNIRRNNRIVGCY